MTTKHSILCIGAGPAGLTAGYLLSKAGYPVVVCEKDPVYVGGISRTENHGGYRFDIGGHRFFSKSKEVNELWNEMLGEAFISRPRKSRIFYGRKFYPYPLNARETLKNLGIMESTRCVLSYFYYQVFPIKNPKSFEEWVTNKFGDRLYRIFFKTYTEKVWGMACSEISADWAAQRIKGLSLWRAVMDALFKKKPKPGGEVVKTLINEFHYPRLGPGMMWEAAVRHIQNAGNTVLMDAGAVAIRRNENLSGPRWITTVQKSDGTTQEIAADYIVNSMPLSQLVRAIQPALPANVIQAANSLRYRDYLLVGLKLIDREKFDDQWIYIHEPGLKVGRIQNFKSWSPAMVPADGTTCYGLEYFCFEGDGLWDASDDALIALATDELTSLGLASREDVKGGVVIRQRKAYPVYDDEYKTHVEVIRAGLAEHCPGICTVGRNGMHKYNNQDHAMMTAMLTAKNIMEGAENYNVWNVNEDAQYHEEGEEVSTNSGASGLRAVPTALKN